MKVLISGCSHSMYSDGPVYGDILNEIGDYQCTNISNRAKDNTQIFTDTIRHISNNPTDVLVYQLTEFERIAFINGEEQSYSFDEPYDGFNNKWTILRFPFKMKVRDNGRYKIDRPKGGPEIDWPMIDMQIGRTDFNNNKMDVIAQLITLQALCKSKGIKLVIINWFGFGETIKSTLYPHIDPSLFLIHNPIQGMENHLLWNAFDYFDVGYHFSYDGHEYIANSIDNFILTGTQLWVEEEQFPKRQRRIPYMYTN